MTDSLEHPTLQPDLLVSLLSLPPISLSASPESIGHMACVRPGPLDAFCLYTFSESIRYPTLTNSSESSESVYNILVRKCTLYSYVRKKKRFVFLWLHYFAELFHNLMYCYASDKCILSCILVKDTWLFQITIRLFPLSRYSQIMLHGGLKQFQTDFYEAGLKVCCNTRSIKIVVESQHFMKILEDLMKNFRNYS